MKTWMYLMLLAVAIAGGCRWNETTERMRKVELVIVGTGAGESMPSIYCVCDFCRRAREAGGKNYRYRTAYQLGEDIHIDWGPDSVAQARDFGFEPWKLKHLFITHSHEDHLFPMDFWIRCVSTLPEGSILNVYGNQPVLDAIGRMLGGDWQGNRIHPVLLEAGKPVTLEDRAMTVTPLAANHMANEQALLFLFETPAWRLLIANDTDVFPEETWQLLAGRRLDVMTIDSTWGMERRNQGHLGIPNVLDMVERLKQQGTLDADSRVIPVHFAHGPGARLHEELERELAPYGLTPAWDGMRVSL